MRAGHVELIAYHREQAREVGIAQIGLGPEDPGGVAGDAEVLDVDPAGLAATQDVSVGPPDRGLLVAAHDVCCGAVEEREEGAVGIAFLVASLAGTPRIPVGHRRHLTVEPSGAREHGGWTAHLRRSAAWTGPPGAHEPAQPLRVVGRRGVRVIVEIAPDERDLRDGARREIDHPALQPRQSELVLQPLRRQRWSTQRQWLEHSDGDRRRRTATHPCRRPRRQGRRPRRARGEARPSWPDSGAPGRPVRAQDAPRPADRDTATRTPRCCVPQLHRQDRDPGREVRRSTAPTSMSLRTRRRHAHDARVGWSANVAVASSPRARWVVQATARGPMRPNVRPGPTTAAEPAPASVSGPSPPGPRPTCHRTSSRNKPSSAGPGRS